ncbi:MAG: NHLP leader peptide family RiPP precursor [Pirellulales bacterium]|nr:NHLP leader peptide family RiPP precursor [Pirellulales bacterium]
MAEPSQDWEIKWELLVADVWADPELKQRLLKDPAKVFAERGMTPPEGKDIKILEETEKTWYMVIPEKPAEGELSEEELEGVAGGFPCVVVSPCRCRCGGVPCGPCGPCRGGPCGGCGPCGGGPCGGGPCRGGPCRGGPCHP